MPQGSGAVRPTNGLYLFFLLAGSSVLDRDLSVSNTRTCNTEFNDVGFARVLNTKLNELPGKKKTFPPT